MTTTAGSLRAEQPAKPGLDDWLERARTVKPRAEAFIGGRFVPAASGRTFTDRASRDGRPIAEVAEGGAEDVDRAVAAARRAFDEGPWPTFHPRKRKAVLLRFAEAVRNDLEHLALLESLDVGKPIRDTLNVDVPSCATTLQWYAEWSDKLYGDVGPTGPEALSLVTREPIGVVGAIVPWNYPLIISAWKIGAGLATGNTIVLKPASQSPLSAIRLAELAAEAGIPDGVLNVLPGPGAVIGDALARHPGVDKIAFTGSTDVGRSLLRAIGETGVKAISLELGGKSPQLVLGDVADLEAAAESIGWGVFYNSGQTCNAGRGSSSSDPSPGSSSSASRRSARRSSPANRSIRRRSSARSSTIGSSARCSATSRSGATRAPASSAAASVRSRRPGAGTSSRRSSMASRTRCASRARRSSARS